MWNILGRQMTPYAVSVWIACAAALGLFFLQGRKLKPAALILTAGLGILLGLLCARLYYVLARISTFLDIGLENFFATADEDLKGWGSAKGAAFWGAVGGVALAALLAGKITKEKVSALLDALAPSAALGIAISRFGEFSIGEGIGPGVEDPALQFFPLAVRNQWDEWYYALFMLEGLVGLIIFALLMTRGRKLKDGYRARMFLILYASCQIVLEAVRRDNFLRWLFVRVSQVASAAVLLGLIVFALIRWAKKPRESRMSGRKTAVNCALFALMVPAIIALEFAVDKSPTLSVGMAYLLETLCCAVMGITSWQLVMKN